MRRSVHDLLVADLAEKLNTLRSGGPYLAVPEVTVDTKLGYGAKAGSLRFDVVAIAFAYRSAVVFEVKTSRADAMNWIRAEKWKRPIELGASVVLAYPESIGYFDLPDEVSILTRGSDWDIIRFPPANEFKVDTELLIGTLRAIRTGRRFDFDSGNLLTDALLEDELAEALAVTAAE